MLLRPLNLDDMCALVVEAYSNSGSASLVAHSYFVKVDGHSSFEAVDGAAAAGSAVMAA